MISLLTFVDGWKVGMKKCRGTVHPGKAMLVRPVRGDDDQTTEQRAGSCAGPPMIQQHTVLEKVATD